MEDSISKSPIKLSNTSSSYAQYLESLPNNQTKEYDQLAQIVLKASKYLLNNICKKCVSHSVIQISIIFFPIKEKQ